MISKELFCKTLTAIEEQDEINREFSKALDLVGNGHFCYGVENKYYTALMDVLAAVFGDEDYISWWLYEAPDRKVWLQDGTEISLDKPEQLYEFLLDNMRAKQGGTT